ncbi:MAG: hypothetical protein IPJ03_19355 [Ignavibacteriales bacterium]|nr:hypothetical protein [Ignavibacteriales bacterium]MBK7381114.1 hypothetical protein [Ignavibacteriales bacterium]
MNNTLLNGVIEIKNVYFNSTNKKYISTRIPALRDQAGIKAPGCYPGDV